MSADLSQLFHWIDIHAMTHCEVHQQNQLPDRYYTQHYGMSNLSGSKVHLAGITSTFKRRVSGVIHAPRCATLDVR